MSQNRIRERGLRHYLAISVPFLSLRSAGIVLLSAVALVTVAAPAVYAQTDTVTIDGAISTSYPEPNPGQIEVGVTSTTALTTLNVDVMSGSTTELSFTLADFTEQAGGTPESGTYQLTTPITVAQLTPGSYTIDVTASDSGGGSATDDSTQFPWLIQPTITPFATQLTFDYQDQLVTFSGVLSLTYPDGSSDTTNLAGQSLLVLGQSTTTTAGGLYSLTQSEQRDGAVYVSINATTTQAAASSPPISLIATLDQAQVTASESAAQLNYGQTLTIRGAATYQPVTGGPYVPLANSTVQLYYGPNNVLTTLFMTTTTNADGQYSFTFKDHFSSEWFIDAAATADPQLDELLSQAGAALDVNVALPLKITGLHASLSPSRILTLNGCLVPSPLLPWRIQYATKKTGPWVTLRTVHATNGAACDVNGATFGEIFNYETPVKVASAFYRLSYPGSNNWEPYNSTIVHEAKDVTRITAFQITPRSVRKNHYVTISGRLWKYAKGWHPLANQHVCIAAYYHGMYYQYAFKPTTSLSGHFKHRFAIRFSSKYFAEYMGGKVFFASASVRLKVTVTSGSAAIGSPRSIVPLPASAGLARFLAETP
jgi:hypothetical protein